MTEIIEDITQRCCCQRLCCVSAICPSAWQVLDSTWSTERGCQGPPVVPEGWCHPPLLKWIIGMATAAFSWPTDQPQVWPAVVAAFTRLEPPRFLSWRCLLHRFDLMQLKFCVNLNKILEVTRFLVMTVIFVSPCMTWASSRLWESMKIFWTWNRIRLHAS